MSREIKFRAWNKNRNEMYDVFSWGKDYVFKDTLDGVGTDGVPDERNEIELMQYTEREAEFILSEDINPDIYESDIIEVIWHHNVIGENCVVKFESGRWIVVGIKTNHFESLHHVINHLDYAHTGRNIHQNPELLNA